MSDLTGKVALVTGASRGIGAGIAGRFAADGADVVITYARGETAARTVVKEIESHGRRALAIQADSADPAAVVASVERVVAEFGRIDILVNNAGFMAAGIPVEDIPLDLVDQTLDVNVRAAFLACQAAARHMTAGGRIINIGSCLGDRVPNPGVTLYAMGKAAITGLTKGFARDLGPRGITVNQISPGPIDTDMNPADGPNAEAQRQSTALGHYGTAADIAAMASYLGSEESRFVTGAVFAVDGGTNA